MTHQISNIFYWYQALFELLRKINIGKCLRCSEHLVYDVHQYLTVYFTQYIAQMDTKQDACHANAVCFQKP